jgi:3-phenylpropionate/trans-cinnamate dioxygenase ferredoxin reductase subunit
MGQVFADLHRANGVDLRCGVQVAEITGQDGRVGGVMLGDGTRIGTEMVIVAIGITPNTGLARDAGLETDDGIRVSAGLETSDPDIYAAGDVASAFHPLIGKHIRLEHWANALNQPPAAARSMLGQEISYDRVPYFYSDQYNPGMEYAGYAEPEGYARVVVRGDTRKREFVAFWLSDDDRVLAGMNVNVWDVQDDIQQLVRAGYTGQPVDSQRLADPGVPLPDLFS